MGALPRDRPAGLILHSSYADRTAARPLVSICIPTFNGAAFIREAVDSALGQTYEPLEVVVTDDLSTDGTYEILREYRDPRLRLERNARRRGHIGNRNHVISRTRGVLVKFLDQDDILDPGCVAEMQALFATYPTVGLVFSRRHILLQDRSPSARAWVESYGEVHTNFGDISRMNDGLTLLARWLRAGSRENWIGEPVAVMLRREQLERTGGFNPRVKQAPDMDLWMRVAAHAGVGFIDRELVGYRHGHPSVSSFNRSARRGWLDRLWTLEGLAQDAEVVATCPEVVTQLVGARREALRTALKLGRGAEGRRFPVNLFLSYLAFRGRHALGMDTVLSGQIAPAACSD
jgi:glycosyltransferase involved in cell wall biosynthesis